MATLWTSGGICAHLMHGMSAKASAGPIMVLQHLCAHGRRRGFRLIHACQSALLGAGRAARMLEAGVLGTPHPTPRRCVMCCRGHGLGRRASQSRRVQTGAWSSWGEPSVVRGRPCTADVRVAHRHKRCHIEVGAPAQQDEDSAVVRTMSRRPRTETSPWYVDPWSPLCPRRVDHHGVDERRTRGVCPGFRAGTKLVSCHPRGVGSSGSRMARGARTPGVAQTV